MKVPDIVIRGAAFIALSLIARGMFAGAPVPRTFHVVCGAAPKDGILSAIVGAPVVFEADALGSYMFTWQFSDGGGDSGRQVTHVFPTGGRQTVSLTVGAGSQNVVSSTQTIQIVGLGSEPNAIVIAGAGFTGTWDTELLLGNPFATQLTVVLFTRRIPAGCMINECPPPVPAFVTLDPNAQRTVRYSELFPPGITGVYLSSSPDDVLDRLPMVRARAYATDAPARAMELPMVTYETLVSRPAMPLTFVGASKSSGSHSNLFLAETADLGDSDVVLRVEAIDAVGSVIGALQISIPAGAALTLSDVLASMGIGEFEGQVRVSQIGGTGIVNGALATLSNDGGFAVSAGLIP